LLRYADDFSGLVCTDGSDLSITALGAGLALLHPGAPVVIVTVIDEPDLSLVSGTGLAGGVLSPGEFELEGRPGPAICQLAVDLSARAIVIGSQGRGGLKRAVLGSVSDRVVRHAPVPCRRDLLITLQRSAPDVSGSEVDS
jgi:nucleotide-binding universal stress UspA family protein